MSCRDAGAVSALNYHIVLRLNGAFYGLYTYTENDDKYYLEVKSCHSAVLNTGNRIYGHPGFRSGLALQGLPFWIIARGFWGKSDELHVCTFLDLRNLLKL